MYDACAGEVWTEGGFTIALFQGSGLGNEVLLEQVQLNFSFLKKFIILLLCGLLVDNSTLLKMCIFKSLTDYTDCDGGYGNRNEQFCNNKIKVNEEFVLVILNCTVFGKYICGVIDCNEWKTEKRHECTNMGKEKRLEL